jgi:hypothetical protein
MLRCLSILKRLQVVPLTFNSAPRGRIIEVFVDQVIAVMMGLRFAMAIRLNGLGQREIF